MREQIEEMEQYAQENNVPIIEKESIFLFIETSIAPIDIGTEKISNFLIVFL